MCRRPGAVEVDAVLEALDLDVVVPMSSWPSAGRQRLILDVKSAKQALTVVEICAVLVFHSQGNGWQIAYYRPRLSGHAVKSCCVQFNNRSLQVSTVPRIWQEQHSSSIKGSDESLCQYVFCIFCTLPWLSRSNKQWYQSCVPNVSTQRPS